MQKLSAPIFQFGERDQLASIDSYTRAGIAAQGELALTGPGPSADPKRWPVRGDLAHIRLAGRVFVPHYAVPMPHCAREGGASLRAAPNDGAEEMGRLASRESLDVLDIAGDWAWGQIAGEPGSEGLVGYVRVDELERTDK